MAESGREQKEDMKNINYQESPKSLVTFEVTQCLLQKQSRKATEHITKYILENNHIYTTRDDERAEMWIYLNGIYIPQAKTYIKEICREILGVGYTPHLCNEVIGKIEVETYIEQNEFFDQENKEKIAVKDGILDLKTKEIEEFNPKKIFFNKIPVAYDKTKQCPNIQKYFKEILSHKDDLNVIQELFGYLLWKDYPIEKAFMFSGSGRNGKGKTVDLMKRFIGVENCANVSLQQLEKRDFSIGILFKKMANLSADISSTALRETGIFKNLTGRDLITADRKFKTALNFVNYAKMVFCCNELPRTSDMTLAFFNRWILLDFPFTFLSQKEIDSIPSVDRKNIKLADTNIINQISTDNELSGLLNWALEGLERLLKQGDFSYSSNTAEVKIMWIRKSDSMRSFLMDCIVEDFDAYISKLDFRMEYGKYCRKHKLKPVNDKWLNEILLTTLNVSEVRKLDDGERIRCWVGIDFKNNEKSEIQKPLPISRENENEIKEEKVE